MKFKIVTAGLLLTLSATLLTACGSLTSSSKDTSSSKRQSETVSQSKAKSSTKAKAVSESKAKASSSALASSKLAASSTKASSESQAASSSAAKPSAVHYTNQQLAIICQVLGQDGANMGISNMLDSMSNSTLHYFADTASTGHNSFGTGASYEQYQLNGDQLTITHPAAQGTAAWAKTFSLSQYAPEIFSVENTALVNGITSKMIEEN